jgi:hypothetical protein
MKLVNKFDTNADGDIDPEEWKQICFQMEPSSGDYDTKLVENIRTHFTTLAKGASTISTDELAYVTAK